MILLILELTFKTEWIGHTELRLGYVRSASSLFILIKTKLLAILVFYSWNYSSDVGWTWKCSKRSVKQLKISDKYELATGNGVIFENEKKSWQQKKIFNGFYRFFFVIICI